jgi:hypothetical protein
MLEIKTSDGTKLVLFPDTAIPIAITSPPFSSIGSHSYDIAFPECDINNKALSYPKRISNSVVSHKVYVYISAQGLPIASGYLKLLPSEFGVINTFFYPDDGNFIEEAGKTNMGDINWGDPIFLGNDTDDIVYYVNTAVPKDLDDVHYSVNLPFNFPMVYAPEFYSKDNGFLGYLNYYDMGGETLSANVISADITKDNNNCLVPFFYLVWIFRKIANHFSLDYSGAFFYEAIFKKIMLLNNFDCSRKEKNYYVRASYTGEVYYHLSDIVYNIMSPAWGDIPFDDDSTTPNEDDDSIFTLSPNKYEVQQRGVHRFYFSVDAYHDYTSDIEISFYLYNRDTAAYGDELYTVTIPVGVTLNIEFDKLVYLDNGYIGQELSIIVVALSYPSGYYLYFEDYHCIIANQSQLNLNQFSKYVYPANHMPDMTALDFIDNNCDYLGLAWFYDDLNRKLHIIKYSDLFLNANIVDISHLASDRFNISDFFKYRIKFSANVENLVTDIYETEGTYDTLSDAPDPATNPNKLIFVRNSGIIFLSTYNEDDEIWEWVKFDDNTLPYEIGDDADDLNEITPSVAPAAMHKFNATINMPETDFKATSPEDQSGGNSFDLQLIQYHGMQEGPYTGKNYPAASIYRWDKDYSDVTGFDLTPEWLAENHFKEYFNQLIQTNRWLEIPLHANFAEIKNLRLWNKYRIGNMIGFIIEINTVLSHNGPYNTTIKFMPLT